MGKTKKKKNRDSRETVTSQRHKTNVTLPRQTTYSKKIALQNTYYKQRFPNNRVRVGICTGQFFMSVWVCVLRTHGGQRSNVSSSISLPYFLRQGLSLTLEFANSARLAGWPASPRDDGSQLSCLIILCGCWRCKLES